MSTTVFGTTEFFDTDYASLISTVCSKSEVRSFTKVFLPVAYSLICIVGLVGNIFVVMTFALYERTKSMTDVYLFNMAIADILFVLTLPLWAVNYAADKWIFGNFICKMAKGIYAINFSCGMLLLAFISVDRYIAIVQATKSFKLRARTLAYSKLICLAVWASAILISSSSFLYSESYDFATNETQICDHRFDKTSDSIVLKSLLLCLQVGFGFFIPFVFMIFCYAFIVKSLQQAQNSKRNKAINVIVLIVVVFLVCQVPYNTVLLMAVANMGKAEKSCDSDNIMAYAKYTTETIAFLHCCLNPVLYAFIGVKFRSYFVKIMKDLWCRRYKKYNKRSSRINSDIYLSRQTSEILTDNASSFTI
ncbi:C-C chemokine receptor type 6 [Gallus gallus]|uniref:C-C chemokine receptor type 6 n=1 Tax=Gallus gallus TaxID=9031 RepID=B0BL89_CHICK|nr:C-C chemokine receptor type 6 [Gallus gallus]XP_015139608.2 C-C chemokine receptor type 6 isoform X1 [Gallus gallus]XP_015139609.2 C-C chemokine receptor type 6 isoform X1 [Gallus gallus]XP_040553257.1 C-C chemokine receptor type 6 isoform X1 [Gallus gallus]XP_040553258.1 C-C chemokine receptor type 6 isoform X1 [Gallus gallus]XP_040553259.1 C-C chemokine receptor type 6 isoform X1 [Gallus gallus]XP_040553260.1 C-C chemokine receptor type 6 isoform X1 [Gallus gallus]XP_046794969.1 C-C che|eukprot:NP_001107553.1 C-C chemokine receptor type 6 [Gallus gallus]